MSKLLQNIILENDRARLSPLEMSHLDALWEIASDKDLWRISMVKVDSKKDLEKFIVRALKQKEAGSSYPFVIFDKKYNRIAGTSRYMEIIPEHKRLEIGSTWLGKEFQGTGLNKACKYELLRFGFEELDLNRIEFKTDAINLQSRRAMEKIGCTFEGTFRSHVITESGRLRDSVYYSIIKPEWPEIKERIFREFIS